MDPFSRKLFKNSDARQKLAQMGGIMSSSPELASTVQRFQVGGDVMGIPPEVLSSPTVQRFAARQGMSPSEYLMSLSPEVRDETIRRTLELEARPAPITAGQDVMGMLAPQGTQPMDDFAMDFGEVGAGLPTAPLTPAETIGLDVPTSTPVGVSPRSADVIDALEAAGVSRTDAMRISDDEVESILGFDDTRFPTPEGLEPFQMRPQTFAGTLLSETFLPERAAAMRQRNITAQSLVDEEGFDDPTPVDLAALVDMAETERVDPDPEPTPPPETDTETEDPLTSVGDQMANDLRTFFGVEPPSRDPKNRRERIEQELELIKDVFGDKTKDQSRERAMNLAMIGLAIAAGQSPNAITNIAQGALAGTQAMQRAQAAAAEREDALRMQAFESVMEEDQRAQTLADRIGLERFKASLGDGAQSPFNLGAMTSPVNRYFERVKQLEEEFGNVENPLWESVRELPYEQRSQVARQIALSEVIPAFEGAEDPQIIAEMQQLQGMAAQMGQQPSPQGAEATDSQSLAGPPVVTTQADYDNLPSGAMFMQNGQLRRKP